MTRLIVVDAGGIVEAVLGCNEKSRAKTLEQGELWVVMPENGRVLPYRGGGVQCGSFRPGPEEAWYQVNLLEGSEGAPSGPGDAPSREHSGVTPEEERPGDDLVLPVLSPLADLIAERRRTMPEGSYTTHLFSKGPGKIRKKTGEEAVELILAEDRQEIIGEAADLLYHTMVLLEQEGIRLETVVSELGRRHSG
ncbi:phosphoribosyl-ATP pyrophosphatase [Alkalispirochaeta americana]|uniref:Phosphoribosyl-ATP pyrophosphatase n=1 Tax=Alkalispirochaeta americana TaxID=159291 RepID=A0A1N6S3U6_9SPIO|nr:phosphoribosyl-ATP diphosphatase [Alkalispirochaeta americana]SIQ35687.1 phosphoribosyl-ATP pyrophosphatase [Alkalispirochaeta americana]